MEWYESYIDQGLVPDTILRVGIRYLNSMRFQSIYNQSLEQQLSYKMKYVKLLSQQPIAIETQKANEQHYEVNAEFLKLCLGKNMKYSGCLYPEGVTSLDIAEELMFEKYCERAELVDGMHILDLGCGWGSLALFLAKKYPKSKVSALSNSHSQREYIESQCRERDIGNLKVYTGDINVFEFDDDIKFDRILSIEMFEHMKNYQFLFEKVSSWLKTKSESKLFLHIFCNKFLPYDFELEDQHSWMARYFFTGGTMPSLDLFLYFQDSLKLENMWYVNGEHYSKTCEAWLQNLDKNKAQAIEALSETYGKDDATKWFYRWRVFYIACSELFNHNKGEEWGVAHYLFSKK